MIEYLPPFEIVVSIAFGIGIVGIGVFKDGTESVLLDVWATRTIV